MDRKKVIFAYEMAVIVPLVLLSIGSTLTGTVIIGTVPGLLGCIGMVIACLMFVHFSLKRRIGDETSKYVKKYDYDCDPQAMVSDGGQIAFNAMSERDKGDPLQDSDAWFLSYYALACIDTGDVASAEKIAAAILEDAGKQKKFAEQAMMLVYAEPVVLRLRGAEAALDVIRKAEEYATFDESRSMSDTLAFINNEKTVLNALIEGDQEVLLILFGKVMNSDQTPRRLRVLGADTVASVCRARGDESGEIHALNFVEQNGNKLPVVKAAEKRLEELLSA